MVALRETHSKSFDFAQWAEHLELPDEQRRRLDYAHRYAVEHYRSCRQEREDLSGEAVLSNRSAEIVALLMALSMDFTSLQAAVLYPFYAEHVFEDEAFAQDFDDGTAELLRHVRDLEELLGHQNLDANSRSAAKTDRVRRMLLAMVDDIRVVVIKLCERIAVIREAKTADEQTRIRIAREVSGIYAPLANRLGIGQIKWELEDLAFRYLHPDIYRRITQLLDERRVDRERYIEDFVRDLRALLEQAGLKCEVYGRPKHIYSIYRKMQRKHVEFSQLYDVRAVRIVVERVQDCYAALGVVHTRWHHIPREFDDYIANPKPNGYQSIHTVVFGPGSRPVEIQIRTTAMHNIAELGVAAHWRYKEGSSLTAGGAEERVKWLRRLFAWREDARESGVLRSEFKSQVFENRVYVFTPRGEVVDLPTGSTPLDFAYQVHTMVGHRCIGAKVDGRIVPFTYELRSGEQVEIITQKQPSPSRDWANPRLGYLKTARARKKVAAWFRKADYELNLPAGIEILDRELTRHGMGLSHDQAEHLLAAGLTRFNVSSVNDLYAGIGNGDIRPAQVLHYLREQLPGPGGGVRGDAAKDGTTPAAPAGAARRQPGAITVAGVDNVLTHVARCCQPIPGDEIMGFVTQGRGISIHRADCRQLHAIALRHPSRIVPAQWGEATGTGYTVTIRIVARDYTGLMRDITTVTANEQINVVGVRSRTESSSALSFIDLDLEIVSLGSLDRLLTSIGNLSHVQAARRV